MHSCFAFGCIINLAAPIAFAGITLKINGSLRKSLDEAAEIQANLSPWWNSLEYSIGLLQLLSGCFMLLAIQRLNKSIKGMYQLREMFN